MALPTAGLGRARPSILQQDIQREIKNTTLTTGSEVAGDEETQLQTSKLR